MALSENNVPGVRTRSIGGARVVSNWARDASRDFTCPRECNPRRSCVLYALPLLSLVRSVPPSGSLSIPGLLYAASSFPATREQFDPMAKYKKSSITPSFGRPRPVRCAGRPSGVARMLTPSRCRSSGRWSCVAMARAVRHSPIGGACSGLTQVRGPRQDITAECFHAWLVLRCLVRRTRVLSAVRGLMRRDVV